MDARILWTLDALAERFPDYRLVVNDYEEGGVRRQSGFRSDDKVGVSLSQHKFGRAVDFVILPLVPKITPALTANRFREMAKRGELDRELQYITRIEDKVNWVHLDCASIPGTEIHYFRA
jgi:hypothetical protein